MWKQVLVTLSLLAAPLFSQGLFDSTVDEEKSVDSGLEINGFIRGVIFGGLEQDTEDAELKSVYGELGLKFRGRTGGWGDF